MNFKARDDSALGQFWAEALGWDISSEGPGVTNVEPVGFNYPDPAAVCIDDPRAMAGFWSEATDWTLRELSDDHARLRSATGVGPIWSSSASTTAPCGTGSTWI